MYTHPRPNPAVCPAFVFFLCPACILVAVPLLLTTFRHLPPLLLFHQVSRSKAVADARKAKGETAHTMVDGIQTHALVVLAERVKSNPDGYRALLSQLITEGLVQIDETRVTLECLESETALVAELCASSLVAYKGVVGEQYKADPVKYKTQYATSLKCTVQVHEKRRLEAKAIGGVQLVGDNGRIVCDNTLRTRLNIVVEEQLPQIRLMLFPSLTAKVLHGGGEEKKE